MEKEKRKTDELYKNLSPIAADIVSKSSKSVDMIIDKIKRNIENLSVKDINDIMLQLSVELYYFAQRKDNAVLMQACSDALYKEGLAKAYTTLDGAAVQKQNLALLETNNSLTVKLLFDATSNLMKSKLDEAHRIVNVLNSALISKNMENKLEHASRESI